MIRVQFQRRGGRFSAVEIAGHSGYGDAGTDIVCAAVSSAFMLIANGLTEVLKAPAQVQVGEDGFARLSLTGGAEAAQQMLQALCLHLEALAETYPSNIHVTISEV